MASPGFFPVLRAMMCRSDVWKLYQALFTNLARKVGVSDFLLTWFVDVVTNRGT